MTNREHQEAAVEERAELDHLVEVLGNETAQETEHRHALPELVMDLQGRRHV